MNSTQLREFHNIIKNDIIQDAFTDIPYKLPPVASSVLDIGCGRGGDIHKYYHSNFKKIIAVDNHIESLNIAKERFEKCYPKTNVEIKYILHDAKNSVLQLESKVNVVVMNFSLNYFFKSENCLRTLFQTVSESLYELGCFVGIALDGDMVKSLYSQDDSLYKIEAFNTFNDTGPYNRAYKMMLMNDKSDDYFTFRHNNIHEYLVCLNELDRIAKIYGLERVYHRRVNSDIPLIKMDFIFKYILMTHDSHDSEPKITNNCGYLFPSTSNKNMNLKTTKDTKNVCSRPLGSKLLIQIITEQICAVPSIIIDGTAHVGGDSIALALHFPNTMIYAIENDIDAFNALHHNVTEYDLPNVNVLHDDTVSVLQQKSIHPIDVLYIDAPWGGVDYKLNDNLSLYLSDIDLSEIVFNNLGNVTLFILKVPNNFDFDNFQKKLSMLTIKSYDYCIKGKLKYKFLSIHF